MVKYKDRGKLEVWPVVFGREEGEGGGARMQERGNSGTNIFLAEPLNSL